METEAGSLTVGLGGNTQQGEENKICVVMD